MVNKQRLTCNSAAPQWSLPAPEKMQCFQGEAFSALFLSSSSSSVTWRASALAEAQCIKGWGCDRVDEQTGCCMTGHLGPYNATFWCVCHTVLSSASSWDGEFNLRWQKQESDCESFSEVKHWQWREKILLPDWQLLAIYLTEAVEFFTEATVTDGMWNNNGGVLSSRRHI